MASKYYAVRKGYKTGIFCSWAECKQAVDGYSGAQYKSFTNKDDAKAFLGITQSAGNLKGSDTSPDNGNVCKMDMDNKNITDEKRPFAFVDGSFNTATQTYGYGGFLEYDGKKDYIQGSGNDPDMASMRNVAGEVLGSMAAVKMAIEKGLTELDIYYDYMGIEMWATGQWKRNKQGTIAYYDYVQSIRSRLKLTFVKVKGHSGVEGNEEADRIAKHAVGIE